ncbi:hypothetical protein BCR34DRAFT_491984 [Clohesyomyces aquaticus]|uniref:Uncharacterized protein n=1 Tax=Clohesyomyces aquaticus TaxID=1231657 RepID=A0A1Y1Z0W2_9PLEO|nr:hypothetical protein BCR34DRAFT_491984 [Clohesyomyces aquaticus]
MKASISIIAVLLTMALGQTTTFPVCTRELLRTDECASVVDANACYNQDRFKSARTLACIDGTSDADRTKKACKCCTCVGTVMCDWVKSQKLKC